jgi:hypothetical protein
MKRKITEKEMKILFDNIDLNATTKDGFIIIYWCFFHPKKLHKLIDNLKIGMAWRFSFNVAKRLK